MRTVAIVGTSLAGLRAAETFRREGFDGRIVAIGAEPHLPYDRPPLSKELLRGDWEPDQVVLRKQGVDDLDLDWRLDTRAVALDLATREIELHDGERVAFDGLVIATGATPRRLANQPQLAGLFTLRTLDDALGLRALLDAGPKVVVIGAGFIGAEIAATCRSRGLEVTVLEMLPQPMVRGLGPEIGAVCGALHRDHGVDLRLGASVEALEGDGRVERVRLAKDVVTQRAQCAGHGAGHSSRRPCQLRTCQLCGRRQPGRRLHAQHFPAAVQLVLELARDAALRAEVARHAENRATTALMPRSQLVSMASNSGPRSTWRFAFTARATFRISVLAVWEISSNATAAASSSFTPFAPSQRR